jgi:hypothetical protein
MSLLLFYRTPDNSTPVPVFSVDGPARIGQRSALDMAERVGQRLQASSQPRIGLSTQTTTPARIG